MQKAHSDFVLVMEASLEQLMDLRSRDDLDLDLKFYRDCLIAFYKSDRTALARLVSQAEPDSPLHAIASLRLNLIDPKFTSKDFLVFEGKVKTAGIWEGELATLIASGYGALGQPQPAKTWFEFAATSFRAAGATGKELRAEMNAIVAIGHISEDAKLISEYYYLYQKARKLNQSLVAATALLNLSREYQKLGALRSALKLCNRAVTICRNHFGSEIHYLILAHRAHLLLELNRTFEAIEDLDLLSASDLPQVQSSLNVLRALFPNVLTSALKSINRPPVRDVVLPTWRERLASANLTKKLLTPSEEALVRFVSEAPRKKFEICDHLFGNDIHPIHAENRLKNLLSRVRKKLPGLFVLEDDQYRIIDCDAGELRKAIR